MSCEDWNLGPQANELSEAQTKDGNKSFPIHSKGGERWQQLDLGLTPYYGSQNKVFERSKSYQASSQTTQLPEIN